MSNWCEYVSIKHYDIFQKMYIHLLWHIQNGLSVLFTLNQIISDYIQLFYLCYKEFIGYSDFFSKMYRHFRINLKKKKIVLNHSNILLKY